MAGPVLDTRTLNRALLARQLLLQRSKLPLIRALERLGGLQTQYVPSAYIGLWSRLDGFQRRHLTRALEQRRAIQGTLMRVTIHVVSARDYPLLTEAVRRSRREWWSRVAKDRALDPSDMDKIASLIEQAWGAGPRRRSTTGYPTRGPARAAGQTGRSGSTARRPRASVASSIE